jgi:hypothetical protein
MAASGAARAEDTAPDGDRAAVGSRSWLAALRHPGAAWSLQVPLRLSWQRPAMAAALLRAGATTLHRPFDLEDYPDPRRAALRTFRLELEGDQDFSLLGAPMNARFVSYEPPIAPQAGPSLVEPLWTGDAKVRLPRNLYGGASVGQRVDGQKAVFVIAGSRF